MSTPLTLDNIDLNSIIDADYTVNEKKDDKTPINDEKQPKNLEIVSNDEDIAPGYIKCEVCGEFFKFLTGSHLVKHNMTMADYKKQYPNALIKGIPPEPLKPLEEITYIDIDGKIRYKDNHKLVDEAALLDKFDISKYEEMEQDFKFLAMSKSKKALQFLDDIMSYDPKKSKDKIPLYTPAVRIKAAELILTYGPPKAAQRKEINQTIKKLSVTIGSTLPSKLKAEDF